MAKYNESMIKNELSISPSILASDFSRAAEALWSISDSGCNYVHLDVMDGQFVPDITFGPKFIKDLKKNSDLIFDTHLMIDKPERMIESFIDAGSDIITVHAEATNHLHRCLGMIKSAGISCGVAINPGTPVSLLEAVLDEVDYVLVMTVNPGWGGQKFINSTLKKIQELDMRREEEGFSYQIEVDGGINRETVKLCYDRGVTLAVMGTAFFREKDKKTLVQEIINSL